MTIEGVLGILIKMRAKSLASKLSLYGFKHDCTRKGFGRVNFSFINKVETIDH